MSGRARRFLQRSSFLLADCLLAHELKIATSAVAENLPDLRAGGDAEAPETRELQRGTSHVEADDGAKKVEFEAFNPATNLYRRRAFCGSAGYW